MMKKLKVLTVIGARPQFVKASAISRVFSAHFSDQVEEHLLHTGQHYDYLLSDIFFEELGLPKPSYQLEIGSAGHGMQTAKMLEGIEQCILELQPDVLLVYGDTNSTLAGALAASKLHIPVVHIEAGLRSFDMKMPEEINRKLTDHVSSLLAVPTRAGMTNLKNEGVVGASEGLPSPDNAYILFSGDVMYDNCVHFTQGDSSWGTLKHYNLEDNAYALATVHRPSNTDDPIALNAVLRGLSDSSKEIGMPVFMPVHPRTQKVLMRMYPDESFQNSFPGIILSEPASYFQMLALEKHSFMIFTDSGGVQKEAYIFGKPCVILRDRTEWVEILETGCAIAAGSDASTILESAKTLIQRQPLEFPSLFGDGHAAEQICQFIVESFTEK